MLELRYDRKSYEVIRTLHFDVVQFMMLFSQHTA